MSSAESVTSSIWCRQIKRGRSLSANSVRDREYLEYRLMNFLSRKSRRLCWFYSHFIFKFVHIFRYFLTEIDRFWLFALFCYNLHVSVCFCAERLPSWRLLVYFIRFRNLQTNENRLSVTYAYGRWFHEVVSVLLCIFRGGYRNNFVLIAAHLTFHYLIIWHKTYSEIGQYCLSEPFFKSFE